MMSKADIATVFTGCATGVAGLAVAAIRVGAPVSLLALAYTLFFACFIHFVARPKTTIGKIAYVCVCAALGTASACVPIMLFGHQPNMS